MDLREEELSRRLQEEIDRGDLSEDEARKIWISYGFPNGVETGEDE